MLNCVQVWSRRVAARPERVAAQSRFLSPFLSCKSAISSAMAGVGGFDMEFLMNGVTFTANGD